MLSAFKIKPFNLEPVFASWTDGPIFHGIPKKDIPVDQWLDQIKAGCKQRNVPEEYWYKVAQHFMGPKARARFNELKAVVAKVHGGKYYWTWKKFKVAMRNMGWEIDTAATETVKVERKRAGWWILGKKDDPSPAPAPEHDTQKSTDSSSSSSSSSSIFKKITKSGEEAPLPPIPTRPNTILRRGGRRPTIDGSSLQRVVHKRPSVETFWPRASRSKDDDGASSSTHHERPSPQKAASENAVTTARNTVKAPVRSNTVAVDGSNTPGESEAVTTVAQAPVWLLNACTALEYITSEHPKAMSVLSAILITVGSIPAIPAISAGAGGAILASGAAHAIGAIAVGLGQALSTSVKNNNNSQEHQQPLTTAAITQ